MLCSLLLTFWCWNYEKNEQPVWWFYLIYSIRSIINNRRWSCLSSAISILTTSGVFLLASWRWHCLSTKDLKTVISMRFVIRSFLLAIRSWFYLNDNWHQRWYYLRAAITVITSIPAFFSCYIMKWENLLWLYYLGLAIAVLSTGGPFLPSVLTWNDIIHDTKKSFHYLRSAVAIFPKVYFFFLSSWIWNYIKDDSYHRWCYMRPKGVGFFFSWLSHTISFLPL